MLRELKLGGVNVGSVEDYQGQEAKVIIISCVLSSRPRMLDASGSGVGGRKGGAGGLPPVGLLSDSRRFNVAVTRGQALCVVIGNPRCLGSDPYWREYVEASRKSGGYYGVGSKDKERGGGRKGVYVRDEGEGMDSDSLNALAQEMAVLGGGVMGDTSTSAGTGAGEEVGAFRVSFDTHWRTML